VLAKPVDGLIDALSELIGRLSIRARLPQIEVAVADNDVALVFRVLDPPTDADKAEMIAFGTEKRLRIYQQPAGLDSVTLLHPSMMSKPLCYSLAEFDITIAFEPIDFVQVNSEINERMVSFAVEQLQVRPGDRVLDLYCGIGNFSLPLARKAGTVLGVEGEASLVQRAGENARRNDVENAEFRVADLSKIDGTESWVKAGWDRLLLDPARSGAADIVGQMHLLGPDRIVYVSCHPGTLARDAGTLVHEKGYKLESAGIIDMFPHTAHVESVGIFIKS
ncbi:MAG: 23S rRNA (uracil(1939)-C(5))-methyltransferase RlmD, partial [Woeseiaceae bacterium]